LAPWKLTTCLRRLWRPPRAASVAMQPLLAWLPWRDVTFGAASETLLHTARFFFQSKDFNEVTFHREDQKLRQPAYPLEKVCKPLSYPLCPRPRLPLSAPPY
jgi:hypothetical protein